MADEKREEIMKKFTPFKVPYRKNYTLAELTDMVLNAVKKCHTLEARCQELEAAYLADFDEHDEDDEDEECASVSTGSQDSDERPFKKRIVSSKK